MPRLRRTTQLRPTLLPRSDRNHHGRACGRHSGPRPAPRRGHRRMSADVQRPRVFQQRHSGDPSRLFTVCPRRPARRARWHRACNARHTLPDQPVMQSAQSRHRPGGGFRQVPALLQVPGRGPRIELGRRCAARGSLRDSSTNHPRRLHPHLVAPDADLGGDTLQAGLRGVHRPQPHRRRPLRRRGAAGNHHVRDRLLHDVRSHIPTAGQGHRTSWGGSQRLPDHG